MPQGSGTKNRGGKMTGRRETFTRTLVLAAAPGFSAVSPVIALDPPVSVAPERMQAMITAFNAWLANIKAPLSGTDRTADVARVTKARQEAVSAVWLEPFANEK